MIIGVGVLILTVKYNKTNKKLIKKHKKKNCKPHFVVELIPNVRPGGYLSKQAGISGFIECTLIWPNSYVPELRL